ncbi:MAG: hypothetical protein IJL14_02475 [Selenomonadaceae bacterium]|nr:hypothetical protein [Selenomonadaceae bacterium]
MATREENLKKINAELDAMSDEELDRVAGAGIDPSTMGDPKTNPNIDPVPGFGLKQEIKVDPLTIGNPNPNPNVYPVPGFNVQKYSKAAPAPIGNPNPNPNVDPVPGFDVKR